ncbi:AbrB family transcriptional regulator [Paracoccus sp. J55]|uniref:AbrB family transcriptional regulator n=1 Tax=Paracoccus sp. J55 TaxID=935849 RepID=UPI0004B50B77|nr:AbrB family transcriptional regulator [Paracoccus sp. J55]
MAKSRFQPPRPPGRSPRNVLLALALGVCGGAAFFYLHLPLAWMMGSLAFCLLGSLAGLPLHMPRNIRPVMLALIGVLLGSNFDPSLFDRIESWFVSLSFLGLFIIAGATLCYLFLRHVARLPLPTAFFGALPGGLAEMAAFGESVGGDIRKIILLQSFRILIVVLTLPAVLWLVLGVWPAPLVDAGSQAAWWPGAAESLWLLVTAGIGWRLALLLRLHSPALIGPMLLSAVIHLTGISAFHPPLLFIAGAQLVMGTSLGSGFAGMNHRDFGTSILCAGATTSILILLGLAFAWILVQLTGLPLVDLMLAFAPGGLSETSLVALSLQATVSFIAVHHVVRVFLITLLAPLFYLRVGGGLKQQGRGD